jgi:Domain of unknown function (DUF4129)
VIGTGLLLALGAALAPLSPSAGAPGASLTVRLPDAVQMVVLALLAFAVVLLLAVQRRRRPSEGEDRPAAIEPRRSAWAAVFSLLPLLLLGCVWYLVRNRGSGAGGDPIERAFTAIAGLLDLLAGARKPPTSVPFFDLTIATLLLLLALAVFTLMVLVALAPRLEKWWAGRSVAEAAPPLSDRVDRPGDPRAEPDPRVAIIRAYGRFEHAVAAARAPRMPCQTPAEFMRTTLARLPVPAPSVTRLTALFEIARFSDRHVGAEARDTACDCLDEIMAALDTEPPRGR